MPGQSSGAARKGVTEGLRCQHLSAYLLQTLILREIGILSTYIPDIKEREVVMAPEIQNRDPRAQGPGAFPITYATDQVR